MLEKMIKVLLVDDELAILANLEAFFEDEGFLVVKAESGEKGVGILLSESIDVAVVDMRLPGIDGNEVMRQAIANGVKTRFIVHTGSNEYLVPKDLAAAGVSKDDVFMKPLKDMVVLTNAVRALMK